MEQGLPELVPELVPEELPDYLHCLGYLGQPQRMV
jgi:hypothetical protein